jgi:short-subunit dehydrogenase
MEAMMRDLDGKWALVTGASSGFGVDFARLLAERGANLVLVARRQGPMEELAAKLRNEHRVQIQVEPMDLAREGVGTLLKSRLETLSIRIDILINNAGFGLFGPFLDQPLATTMNMLHLNIMSLTEITHAFAADMALRGGGQILLISSIGGYQATPLYAAYSASKAYVLLFGEALHEEMKAQGVSVTVLSPGITATGFLAVTGQKPTLYQRVSMMQSRPVAEIGLNALKAGRASIVPGLINVLTLASSRFTPRWAQRKLAYQLMKN